MKIEIEKYKNIDKIKFEVMDNMVNHVFGISGSGKSSIANSLSKKIEPIDIKIGYNIDDCIIKVNNKKVDNNEFSIFDLDNSRNLVLSKEGNSDVYNILFSDESLLEKTYKEYEQVLSQYAEFRNLLKDFRTKIDNLTNHFDIRINKDGSLNRRSKFYKLENELLLNRKKQVIDTINQKGAQYIKWLQDGEKYKENISICPYCNGKISNRRISSINKLLKITPKNFELITNDNNYMEEVGIKKPKYTNIREVNRAKKEIIDMINFRDYIDCIIEMFDSYKSSNLDMSKINAIKISSKFKKIFPGHVGMIDSINNNLKIIKNKLGKIIAANNRIIKKNKKNINKYLSLMGIPYEFCESEYDNDKRIASYSLFLKKDKSQTDRRGGLSYGERNIVALIFFLLSSNSKTLLIDDPASSYDEFRRDLMFKMIYEFQNNRTIILFSHDQVFIKLATLYKYRNNKIEDKPRDIRKIIENTGCIYQFSNYNDNCKIIDIKDFDFGTLESQTRNFISNQELSYFRKVINIRILAEIGRYKKGTYAKIYNYISAIFHNHPRDEIHEFLRDKNWNEREIIDDIKDKFNIELGVMPDNYLYDFNYNELSNYEKIYFCRELLKKGSNKFDELLKELELTKADLPILKTEFDSILHLNGQLFISLNPYNFDYFSPTVYSIINKKDL